MHPRQHPRQDRAPPGPDTHPWKNPDPDGRITTLTMLSDCKSFFEGGG